MSVELAAQTLSLSVYNALKYLHEHTDNQNLKDCVGSAKFCIIFNISEV